MLQRLVSFGLLSLVLAVPAHAERVQVFSIQGVDCAECAGAIRAQLKKVRGYKKADFDVQKVELTVKLDDPATDEAVLEAIQRAGFTGFVGPGKGAYLPHEKYPDGADVVVVTGGGAAVGPLEKLRVPGKYTVFDVYADWCGPCRKVDAQLREVVTRRQDVAVRKLNVVGFQTPLARELGRRLTALPYVVVFAPDGKRTEIVGADLGKLASALGGD